MTHAVRLVVPSLVLVMGFGAACLFRRPVASRTEIPASSDRPATFTHARHATTEGLPMEVPGARGLLDGLPDGAASGRATTAARKPEERTPNQPRGIAPDDDGDARRKAPGDVRRRGLGAAAFGHRHRVVDGDSLRSLAARYLGDASRADEIFQANRKRLSHPDALPIGLDLEIPPP